MNCILLGSKSEIAQGLKPLLEADGWRVYDQYRERFHVTHWDLWICCIGRIRPVGLWHDNDYQEWEECVESNLFLPIRELRFSWNHHKAGATVCFMAGSNPNMIMDGYSAYNTSKMALLKFVEQADHETPDAKFFALGPGTILTKIHKQSEGWNNPKLKAAKEKGENRAEKIQKVYDCLKWCISQPKEVVGGRNICVSDPWNVYGFDKSFELKPDLLKLRRYEGS